MHIAKIPNRNARPSFLLRETFREDGKVKNRTLANLSKLPLKRIDILRANGLYTAVKQDKAGAQRSAATSAAVGALVKPLPKCV
jgi:hypothetical protein